MLCYGATLRRILGCDNDRASAFVNDVLDDGKSFASTIALAGR